MKIRIIPTILTDGLTVVKGEQFNNWRTVGTAEASARLYASKDVDELLFLDVTARSRKTIIDKRLLIRFSSVLDIPFTVGGGISNIEDSKMCFRNGAEKVVLGTSAILNPRLITDIANIFGSQAVIVSVDFDKDDSNVIRIMSGKLKSDVSSFDFIEKLEGFGAGEVLLQSIQRDGTLGGMNFDRISKVCSLTKLPVIASGGAASVEDFVHAVKNGASAVSAGALFQFTEITPRKVRNFLTSKGISTRVLG